MDDQNGNIFAEFKCNSSIADSKISNIIPHDIWDGLNENDKNDRA